MYWIQIVKFSYVKERILKSFKDLKLIDMLNFQKNNLIDF